MSPGLTPVEPLFDPMNGAPGPPGELEATTTTRQNDLVVSVAQGDELMEVDCVSG
jgi:hypothetical protein